MKNLEKYICVFDKYRKENKYQHFKIEENHNTILKNARSTWDATKITNKPNRSRTTL
ncbi:Uncharacterised protein [Mycoplasmopsis bovirhinis]|uniref:Uncharacterized protein n=1 Tax=Mycoplasmopsis bovirhinis TaxID=29553 RepID=A0A449AF18_9BACT|nr:Uncharacterised protein [Mycoplasmopsis bovirhinis]